MSETTLFCFGAVIFLIAFTGAILYGMSATEQQYLKQTKPRTKNAWQVSLNGIISNSDKASTK